MRQPLVRLLAVHDLTVETHAVQAPLAEVADGLAVGHVEAQGLAEEPAAGGAAGAAVDGLLVGLQARKVIGTC